MQPVRLALAFDSGWSDGDPGSGRLRFDTPKPARARFVCVNARDSQDAVLDELVPTWGVGDVLVIERPGATSNRWVGWVVGPIVHRGSYYKVPVKPRTVTGAFAAHDELALHHHRDVVDVEEPEIAPGIAPLPIIGAAALPPPAPLPAAQPDAALAAENAELRRVLQSLVSDNTPLYAVETET